MAVFTGIDVAFNLVGGFDLLPYTNTITPPEIDIATEDTTVFGVSARQYTSVSLEQFKYGYGGFYDDTVTVGPDAVLQAALSNSNVAAVGVQGNTVGKYAFGMAGQITNNYKRLPTIGKLTKFAAMVDLSGVCEESQILYALALISGATNTGTAQDNGASSAAGGSGYAFVTGLSLGGYTALQLKVQHSADNSSWSDLITFTVQSTAHHAERLTVAGSVNRYTRATLAYTGSGSAPSATVAVLFHRN